MQSSDQRSDWAGSGRQPVLRAVRPTRTAGRAAAPGLRASPRSAVRVGSGLKLDVDPLRIALLLMMVMGISRIHQHFGLIARLRPSLLLALLALVYALANPRLLNSDKLLKHWPTKVMLALGIWACLSIPFGLSIGGSARFMLTAYLKVLIFAFLLVAAMRTVKDLNLFVWGYVASCGLLVFMAWFVFGMKSTTGDLERLANMYTWDANDVGLILLIGLPLALLTMQTSGPRGRAISIAIMVGIGATLARTGSRGAFLGAIAVGIALLVLLRQVSPVKRILFVVVAGGALFATAPQGYWSQMQTLVSPQEDYNWYSSYGRKQVWSRGVGYMMSNPLLGIGIHNFARAEGTISEPALRHTGRGKIKWSAPHNSFVEAMAELGLPGLFLWSSLVFGGMISLFRLRRRLPSHWARGDPEERFLYLATGYIPIAILGFAVSSFFLSFAWLQPVYILAAFVVGVYVAIEAKLGQRVRVQQQPAPALIREPAWRAQLRSRRPLQG